MANHNEKNLLNEITYLSRLIGQHKKGLAPVPRKWESVTSVSQKMSGYLSHKVLTQPHFPVSQSRGVQPYKYVNPNGKRNNLSQALKNQEKKNVSVYINPKFQSGSLPRQQSSNTTSSTCLLQMKSSVHINPHFSPDKCAKTFKMPVNRNVNRNEICVSASTTINPASSPAEKLKVHLNPKFCKLLPDNSPQSQLRTLMTNKVHVNPKLVEKVLKEKNKSENQEIKNPLSMSNKAVAFPAEGSCKVGTVSENSYADKNTCIKPYLHKGTNASSWKKSEFLTLGKRKLVRVDQKLKLGNEAKHKDRNKSPRSSFSLTRNRSQSVRSQSVKKTKVITSKYKIVKNHSVIHSATKQCTNKYKIDRRCPAMKRPQFSYIRLGDGYRQSDTLTLRTKKSHLMKSELKQGRYAFNSVWSSSGNMAWRRTWSLQAKEFKTTNAKLYRIGSTPTLKKKVESSNNDSTFNKSLVRIGGVLYKSSRNKLTRSQEGSYNNGKLGSGVSLKKKGKGVAKGQVLFIRGQKFVMDPKGKTLRRLSTSNLSLQNVSSLYSFHRVDIGGVTFVKKSSNLLMRTNTHKARSLLSYAKQKSIATLMKKLKKNNQPCIFFQKFGRCFRMEKGTCPCVHDRKHVAVCKRFLQGKCFAEKCLLSHDVGPEKMPTCKYFLEGCCNRQNCPYLHVKVNSKAEICTSFLQGYCANGKKENSSKNKLVIGHLKCARRDMYACVQNLKRQENVSKVSIAHTLTKL
ncbi:uncharacterized protein ZC3H3 isoform X2 [Hetaerina americana]|uniref:uncharacterized protein ZC3H3 isoform X2 n=1 Tax=Hetaerina americana TaxID=62018 RepID=UPI003A7F4B58